MHANDERDPLDRWLSQQVQPLPPPPGTFELITRRARGRKIRKLAVTLASAAAVAAAVAVAVPVGLNLRLSPSPTHGANAANSSKTSASANATGTQSPTSTGQHTLTPSAKPSPTASSIMTTPVTEPSGPVPTGFLPTSVTFDSQQTAWVIGQGGVPGHCIDANPNFCTSVVRTDNAGKSWQGGPAPKTSGQDGPVGVSGIRFLNGTDGWAFGPELFSTHDEGNHWTRVNTGGARVTDLETSGGRAYALWAMCTGTSNFSFAENCTSYTLMSTPAGGDNWQPVGHPTNGLTNGGRPTSAVLELTGTNGYLLAPDGTLYSGPIGGTWTRVGTVPCQPGTVQANGLPANALLALADSTQLYIACNGLTSDGPPPTSASGPPAVYSSDNSGALWTQLPAGTWSDISDLGSLGFATSLSAAPDTALMLATTKGIYTLTGASGRWKPTSATGSGAPNGGFTYVGMTNDEQGVALPAAINLHQIWMTFDGGATWAPTTTILPPN